jgi:hypothetical protein
MCMQVRNIGCVYLLVRTSPQQTVRAVPVPNVDWTHCWIVAQQTMLKTVKSWVSDYDPDQQLNVLIPYVPINEHLVQVWTGPINDHTHYNCI